MRFHSDRSPIPYLNRREQYRLLAMVVALCVVMAAVQWSARPSSWYWLIPPDAPNGARPPELDEIDFRVQPRDRTPPSPETFRAAAVSDPPGERLPDEGDSVISSTDFPAELLATIDDNTLGMRRRESEAYEAMLSRVRRLSDDAAAERAQRDVAFTVLMLNPDDYRGRLLAVEGELRRLTEITAGDPGDSAGAYEGWLFTSDSGTNPYRIVCTEIPDGLAPEETLAPPVPVRVVGYFFKRYGYASRGGQHVAPMLIARTLHRLPPPPPVAASRRGPELRNAMLGLIAVVVAGVLALGVWFFLSDRRFRRSPLERLAASRLDAEPQDLAALGQVETIDPDRPFATWEVAPDSSPTGTPPTERPLT